MKVIQTPVRFFPAIGGVEKHVLDLSSELVKRGHDVKVFCANEPPSPLEEVQGISIKRLPYVGKIANTNITASLLVHLMREDFDLIHTHFPAPWAPEVSLLAAKLRRSPCILTYHNDVEKSGILGLFARIYSITVLRILLAGVDLILITQAKYLAHSRYLAPDEDKVKVIPNGVTFTSNTTARANGFPSVLFVGVLDKHHRYKVLDVLLHAVRNMKNDWPEITLNVVGGGDLVAEYQLMASRLDLAGNVQFLGRVDDIDRGGNGLSNLYRQCSLLVLPSIDRHEGFGIVLLEAMAHGKPVVTTEAAGLSSEIRENGAGIVVSPNDPDAVSQAMDRLLSEPVLSMQMGRNGVRLVREKYLWSEIVKSVEKIYKDVLN